MIKLFKIIIFFILIIIVSTIISNTQGTSRIDWLGWGIEIETSYFVLILFFVCILLIFLDRFWRFILSFPSAAIQRKDKKNREKVEKSLVKAFLLASHGEYKEAAKEATLIAKNTYDKKLGFLIKEHSKAVQSINQLAIGNNEQNNISDNYLQALSNDKNTSFIGHLAKMRMELAKNDNMEKVFEHANEAYKLDINSEQVLKTMFYVSIKLKKIDKAIEISKNSNFKKIYNSNNFNYLISDLYYLDGLQKLSKNKREAEKSFLRSVENFSGNILAVLNLVKLIRGMSARNKSIKILKEAFFISPHVDLLDMLIKKTNYKTSGEKVSYAIQLLKSNTVEEKNVNEVKILVAEYSLKQKIYGEAKKLLEDIAEINMTNKGFQLLADLESSKNNTDKVSLYLKKAAKAKLNYDYFCLSCGFKNGVWHLNCKNCDEISTIRWTNQPNPNDNKLNRVSDLIKIK